LRKLELALKLEDVEHFVEYARGYYSNTIPVEEIDHDYELILGHLTEDDIPRAKISSEGPSRFIQLCTKQHLDPPQKFKTHKENPLKRVIELTKRNLKTQYRYNQTSCKDGVKQFADESIQKLEDLLDSDKRQLDIMSKNYLVLSAIQENLPRGYIPGKIRKPEEIEREKRSIIKSKRNVISFARNGITMYWSRKILCLDIDGTKFLLPSLCFQEVHNKVADLMSVMVFAKSVEGSYIEKGASGIVQEFVENLFVIHNRRTKTFFSFAGAIEALAIGIMIERYDDWEQGWFLDNVLEDVKKEYEEASYEFEEQELRIIEIMQTVSTPLLCELSCLTKVTGHPIGSIAAGIAKLHSRTNAPKDIDLNAVMWTKFSLKEDYLTQYFVHHGSTYPEYELDEGIHPRIEMALKNRKSFNDPSVVELGNLTNADWAKVHIKQCDELDYLDNMLPYLKDKATSVLRSRAVERYITGKKRFDKKDKFSMNALMAYLVLPDDEIDHVSHVKEFEDPETDITDLLEYMAIRLVGKEKELKTSFRFFGAQTYLSRCRCQVILQYAKKFLERYSSDQALVLSELSLMKKLHVFSKMRFHGGGLSYLTLSLDVTAWNNNFTTTTVGPVMAGTIDEILGNKLFSRAHHAFENTLYYTEAKGGNLYWEGQLGGIEGLMQEVWMITYIHQIKYALRDCPYENQILCKGDDVRIRFLVPDSDKEESGMENIAAGLRGQLEEGLKVFGHSLKVNESYASTSVMAFSKKIYVHELAMPSSFRQIQKTYGANNAFLPTLEDYIAAAYSNAHSASAYGINHLGPYATALFWTYLHLTQESSYHKLNDDQLLALTLIPQGLGGFPIIYLHNMFVRSESDLISAACGLYIFMRDFDPPVAAIMEHFIHYRLDARPEMALLLANPYAIPVKRPRSANSILKDALRQCIKKCTQREEVRVLFSGFSKEFQDTFIETIKSAKELDVKLASAIFSCSPVSIVDQFISKFANSRSVIKFLISSRMTWRQVERLLSRVVHIESENNQWRIDTATTPPTRRVEIDPRSYICPTKMAEDMRDKGWDMKIKGVTHPPIQHQLFLKAEAHGTIQEANNHFLYQVHDALEPLPYMRAPQFSPAAATPFLGNITPSGTIGSPIQIDSKNIVVRNIRTLLMLLTMIFLEDRGNQPARSITYEDIIKKTLKCYTTLTNEELRPFQDTRKSGSRDHHLQMQNYKLQIIMNSIKNMMTMITTVVDTHKGLRLSSDNYRINFLHFMCHSASMLMMDWSFPDTKHHPGAYWGILNECKDCHTPIVEPNSYFTNRAFLDLDTSDFEALRVEIVTSGRVIEKYLKDAEERHEFRIIKDMDDPSLEEAQRVLASELTRLRIQDRFSLAYAYNIMVPTAANLADLAQLKSRPSKSRSLSGSEIAKIPGWIIAMELIPFVMYFTYHNFDLDDTDVIASLYRNFDGQMLPWAPLVTQLAKSKKLYSVLSAICKISKIPVSSAFSAMINTSQACIFIGRNVACWVYDSIPDWLYQVRTPVYAPSSSILNRIEFQMWVIEHIRVYNFPLEVFVEMHNGTLRVKEEADIDEFNAILGPLFLPYITEEGLQKLTKVTKQKIHLEPLSNEESDDERLRTSIRTNRRNRNLLSIWNRNSRFSLSDVDQLLMDHYREDGIVFTEEAWLFTIKFMDLPACYSLVRSEGDCEDTDDFEDDQSLSMEMQRSMNIRQPNAQMFPYSPEHMVIGKAPHLDLTTRISQEVRNEEYQQNLDLTHLTRCGGYGTTSAMKLNEILKDTWLWKIRKEICGTFVCLADGEGGDSRFLVENFPNVRLFWNSKVFPDRSAPASIIVGKQAGQAGLAHPRIKFFTQKNIGGDLLKPLTLDIMKKECGICQFVKCDADIPQDETRAQVAEKLWYNVLKFFLETSANDGVLIIKVFLDLTEVVSGLLSLTTATCEDARVFTLTVSHLGYEAYLMAHSKKTVFTLPGFIPTPTPQMRNRIKTMRDDVRNMIQAQDNGEITPRERNLATIHQLPRTDECIVDSKLSSCLNPYFITIDRNLTRTMIIGVLDIAIKRDLSLCTSSNTETVEARAQLHTLTHKIRILHQVMKSFGFHWVLTNLEGPSYRDIWMGAVDNNPKHRIMNEARSLLRHDSIINRFPHLDRTDPLNMKLYCEKIPLELRSSLLQGAKSGMECLASMCRERLSLA